MSEFLFRCKTDNACHIKTMSEVISNILKSSFWEIGKDGIKMTMFDQNRKTMVSIQLDSINFSLFQNNSTDDIFMGMNSTHLYKMLKSIKKKDTVELFILVSEPSVLNIRTIPVDQGRITTSSIKIQSVQNLDVNYPSGFTNSVVIRSSDFQKMVKDLTLLGSGEVKISDKSGVITFSTDAGGIMKRGITLGEENEMLSPEEHVSTFDMNQFERIYKISSLCECMYLFPSTPELPFRISTRVGNLGEMSIYIKSNEIIELEKDI